MNLIVKRIDFGINKHTENKNRGSSKVITHDGSLHHLAGHGKRNIIAVVFGPLFKLRDVRRRKRDDAVIALQDTDARAVVRHRHGDIGPHDPLRV